ncbi:MAG TPA: hypothetical protein VGM33_00790 [Baekduia sp.]
MLCFFFEPLCFFAERSALDLSDDPAARARVAVLLGVAHCLAGQAAEAVAVLAEGRADLGGRDPDALAELEAVGLTVATYMRDGGMPDRERFAALEPLTHGGSWGARALAAMLAATAAHTGMGTARVTGLLDRALDGPIL